MIVDFKIHGIFKADPQKCYEELPEIVTPANVLEVARNKNTELHKCFTWNNDEAAEKWRLKEARQLIQLFVIKTEKQEVYKPRIFQATSKKNVYQETRFFVQNKNEYTALVNRAKAELIAIQNRYKEITEMEEIFEAIDNFINN